MAYTLIQTTEVGSGGAASILFENIPQEAGASLELVISGRSVEGTNIRGINLIFNGDTGANYGRMRIYGDGSTVDATGPHTDNQLEAGWLNGATTSANTFGSGKITISNYASSTTKNVQSLTVTENNGSVAYDSFFSNTWSGTSGINSILLSTTGDLAQYTSASLYLVTTTDAAGAGTVTPFVKATGGTVSAKNGYWYHTFTGSGTFTPLEDLTCDYLVLAGGGGGGNARYMGAGGGGAGGYLPIASTAFTANANYSVVVGAGGAGGNDDSGIGGTGSNSTFNGTTATAGGGGGGRTSGNSSLNATSGGSGGGGHQYNGAGASGVAGQGNSGGSGLDAGDSSGGGGGANASGANGTNPNSGNGGAGLGWFNNIYYAGGGGGGKVTSSSLPGYAGTRGYDGGGNGGQSGAVGQNATINLGGGGGGAGGAANFTTYNGGSGSSGIVVVRYAI